MTVAEAEYFGGPADGRREAVPVNPVTGCPPAIRICTMRIPSCGMHSAARTEFYYDRGPARPDGVWVYRMRRPG